MSDDRSAHAPLPTISEQVAQQLGGWRGAVEATVPVLAFVVVNAGIKPLAEALGWTDRISAVLGDRYAVKAAVIVAVLVVAGVAAFRLSQKRTVRHAMNGLLLIAVGAWMAWRSGEARDFYLPGILYGLGYGAVLLLSAFSRWPAVGWIWSVLVNGGRHDWRTNPRLMSTFRWLTVVWGAVWLLKVGVQLIFYLRDSETGLAITRLALGYPPYLLLLALTIWAVRRVRAREVAEVGG